MQRVVSFYEKLPRGPAPEVKAKGLLGRYQARYFGAKPSAARKESPRRTAHCAKLMGEQLSSMPLFYWGSLVMHRTTTSISVSLSKFRRRADLS